MQHVFRYLGLWLSAGLLILACCQSPPSERYNVLFILVDDLGHADLGVTGSYYYETPHINRLAESGMVFTQGYSGSRVCSPSRATIMTGKFTARHGITDWIGAKSGREWRTHERHDKLLPASYIHNLNHQDTTIAEALRAQGYKTFYAGKWHLGNEGSYPEDHGFEVNKGGWEKGSPIGGYFSPWENPRLENKFAGENLSMRLAQETAAFIEQHQDSTFFAVLSFYAVHGPIQTTREKWGKYRAKAEIIGIDSSGFTMERVLPIRNVQDNPVYAGLVETMDDAVGLVLEALKVSGLMEKTIIIFTSDNGGVASGDNFSTSNLPLRGGKGYQWEGGLRVPYFIKVPGTNAGTCEYPVTGADFFPTILDLLDIPLIPQQHRDGISLKPILESGENPPPRALIWHYPHYGNQGGNPSSVIRSEDWKLIHYWEQGNHELYRLSSDIGEQLEVSAQYPQVTDELSRQLHRWLTENQARFPSPDPDYDSVAALERSQYLEKELWPRLEAQRLEYLSKDYQPNPDWWGSEPVQ